MLTSVCITVDTEFSIAGAFADHTRQPVAEPLVWCDVAGRSEGLGFLLACFRQCGIPATFFVEALHRNYFRHDPMRAIAKRIHEDGHEIQLHAHPCWTLFRYPDWRARIARDPDADRFHDLDEARALALIQEGQQSFSDWGLPAPQVFRSASLQHDDALYRALARSGMPYSSNVGLAIYDSGDARYQLYAGRHLRHGVLECPVLTFRDFGAGPRRHLKTLTITGASFAETRSLLGQAQRAGLALVVILTHPFEFVQSGDDSYRHLRRHAVNQNRMIALCRFLDSQRDRFIPSGLARAAGRQALPAEPHNPLLAGSPWQAARRIATQLAYDRYGRYALSLQRGKQA